MAPIGAADDEVLLRRYVRERDVSAFDALAQRYLSLVRSACRCEISDAELAEDAASTTLLIFAERAGSIRGGSSLPAWLFETARRTARNVRRREETHTKRAGRLEEEQVLKMPESPFFDLDPVLANLSEKHRAALLMRFDQGLSLAEIGKEMGVSEDAARMLVNRSLRACRRMLRRDGKQIGIGAIGFLLHQRSGAQGPPEIVTAMTRRPVFHLSAINLARRSAAAKWAAGAGAVAALTFPAFASLDRTLQESAVRQFLDDAAKRTSHFRTLQADRQMQYTIGSEHFQYVQQILVARPNRYIAEIGVPYRSKTICDGADLYNVSSVGTPDEGYDRAPSIPKTASVPPIDAFLGRDVIEDAEQFLATTTLALKKAQFKVGFGASEKRDGKAYKVVEIRQIDPPAFIKYFVAPNGLLEGEEASLQCLYVRDDGHGNRSETMAPETYTAFLKNIRLGEDIPDKIFAYDTANHRSLRQPNTLATGTQAPDFTVGDPVSGQQIHLRDLARSKKGVLIDFWFASCAPCRAAMPDLNRLQARLGDKGLAILCVNGMDSSDTVRSIFQKEGLTMTPAVAPMRKWGGMDQCAWDYGVRAYPTQFLVDSDMRIVWMGVGADERGLDDALAKLGIQ